MRDDRVREYVAATRIVEVFGESTISNLETLLDRANVQSSLRLEASAVLRSTEAGTCGFLVDFGKELYGGIRFATGNTRNRAPVHIRVRFGESVSEAMHGGTSDHGTNDQVLSLPWLGSIEFGNTGFRFVRIDLVDDDSYLELQGMCAVALYRDLEWLGHFESSDEELNRIWKTAVHTVQLTMQDYIWDGIKRDRLVWAGDLHPEIRVISTVFGDIPVVRQTLDLIREQWPVPGWMNGISSYTLWWIITHFEWYRYGGDLKYLGEQREYFLALVEQLEGVVDGSGSERLPPNRFLDWPSSGDEKAIHAGLQSLLVMAVRSLSNVLGVIDEQSASQRCARLLSRLELWIPEMPESKQAAALLAISGLADPDEVNRTVLSIDPFSGISTFYGYYVLEARVLAGDIQGCVELIKRYWGAMLEHGATTFWEGFDLSWTVNAGRIDELPDPGRADIHSDFGDYCYKGLRHSLCHGWAGGPAAWLINHVLGLRFLEPGGHLVEARPSLGGLSWAKGAIATPYGPVRVEYERTGDGTVSSAVSAPEEVHVTLR